MNLVHITIERFDVLTKIGWIMPYAATHCRVGGTTSPLPITQGDNIECSCMNVAVHLCRHIGIQLDHFEQIPYLCSRKTESTFSLKKKKGWAEAFFETGELVLLHSAFCFFCLWVLL